MKIAYFHFPNNNRIAQDLCRNMKFYCQSYNIASRGFLY